MLCCVAALQPRAPGAPAGGARQVSHACVRARAATAHIRASRVAARPHSIVARAAARPPPFHAAHAVGASRATAARHSRVRRRRPAVPLPRPAARFGSALTRHSRPPLTLAASRPARQDGDCPLQKAVLYDHREAVVLLIAAGARVDAPDSVRALRAPSGLVVTTSAAVATRTPAHGASRATPAPRRGLPRHVAVAALVGAVRSRCCGRCYF